MEQPGSQIEASELAHPCSLGLGADYQMAVVMDSHCRAVFCGGGPFEIGSSDRKILALWIHPASSISANANMQSGS
jgi:hypothetical protein